LLLLIVFIILSIPLFGYFILTNDRVNPTGIAWFITLASIFAIYFFVPASPLLLMLLYIMSTFMSLKIVVATNHLGKENQLNFKQWCLFCYAWFGMNPLPFKSFPAKPLADYPSYFKKGITRILAGILLINGVQFIRKFEHHSGFDFIFHLSFLIALSLILHFGLLNISAGSLRRMGIPVTSLFKDPIKSQTLQEFWSKRWNVAFVELTTLAVVRPLKQRFGPVTAFWISYVFSGLLHELAISLPVNSGFGKPFLYFIIQALLIMTMEKYLINRLPNGATRTCWVLACLFVPIFLLFHKEFILQIVVPLVNYLTFIS
jgi:alginate O-acetyltransferase complex protein AlgI